MNKPTLKTFVVQAKDRAFGFKSDHHRAIFRDFVKQFEGQELWLTVDSKMPVRSLRQNAFYWLYLTIISGDTGDYPEDLHELFKYKFLSVKKKVLGELCDVPLSTTNLSKIEFGDYMEKICALTGVPIPDPTPFNLAMTHEEYQEYKNEESIRKSKEKVVE